MGHKNPKIIVEDNDYCIYRKLPDKTIWYCTQYHKKDRCKARVVTQGRKAILVGKHNHHSVLKPKSRSSLLSQKFYLKRIGSKKVEKFNLR